MSHITRTLESRDIRFRNTVWNGVSEMRTGRLYFCMTQITDAQKARVEAQLFEWISIPSVSTDPAHAPDVRRAANWLKDHLENIGLKTELWETARHPVVYAENLNAGLDAPTILYYGHYDVQPADPLDEWKTPPFEPTIRDGYIYARGSSDDKGQVFAHVKALETAISSGRLAVNVKMLIEGEEEIGSQNLTGVIDANLARLTCDAVVISDGAMFAPGVPMMTTGLRGLCYLEIHVQGANADLHSGMYGGAVANPLNALAFLISKLKDEHGQILVPGVFDKVREVPESERAAWRKLPFNESEFAASVGVNALPGEDGFSVLERLWSRPTLDVNGIWGGFQGQGAKTVLPNKASAKVSMRLVPDQEPEEIAGLVKSYLESICPPGVTCDVKFLHGGKPVVVDVSSDAVQAGLRAIGRAYPGHPVAFVRAGGSIPVVATFRERLGAPVLLVDLGLPDDGLHGPNERFSLECLHKGVEVAGNLLDEFGRLK
jgi:acetylornithine deacetylase/succinyl-diaminopimelate desuccinylase-like protein